MNHSQDYHDHMADPGPNEPMTTPNLEQIATNTPVSSPEDSINRVVTWMTGRLMQEHDRNTTLSILRRKLEEHYQRLTALRQVAPQPAKEEVREVVARAIEKFHAPSNESVAMVSYILSAIAPYIDAGREPCRDSVRLQLVADQLAVNFAVTFLNTDNGVQFFSGGFLRGEGKSTRDAIDSAAAGREAT